MTGLVAMAKVVKIIGLIVVDDAEKMTDLVVVVNVVKM